MAPLRLRHGCCVVQGTYNIVSVRVYEQRDDRCANEFISKLRIYISCCNRTKEWLRSSNLKGVILIISHHCIMNVLWSFDNHK